MHPRLVHRWDVSPQEACAIQETLRRHVITSNHFSEPIRTVAGVDVHFADRLAHATIVVCTYPEMEPVEIASAEVPVTFPYIPGLLAFREGPPVLDALARLSHLPDLLLFDAHGLAHPRRVGLATHLGVLLDLPSVGCAKSCLCGSYPPLDPQRGAWVPLTDDGETIGAVVRTRTNVRPVYVSIGHRVDLPTAVQIVLTCATRYRIPDPLRLAHCEAKRISEACHA